MSETHETSVHYTFEHAADDTVWVLVGVVIEEALNEPYVAWCELATNALGVDAELLLGHDAAITIERITAMHRVYGIIDRVEKGGTTVDDGSGVWQLRARVRVVPALEAMRHRVNTRIWPNQTAKQILETLLPEALGPYARDADLDGLDRAYPVREYCVQYQESDFAFASRLMEEEGIAYSFVHDEDERKEKLVLTDNNDAFPEVVHLGAGAIPLVAHNATVTGEEPVRSFLREVTTGPTSIVVRDFDWSEPRTIDNATQRTQDALNRDREVYDHGLELTIGEYDPGVRKYTAHDPAPQAELRRQLQIADQVRCRGFGRVIGFAPGTTFELTGHTEHPELEGEYVLTRVVHRSRPYQVGGSSDSEEYHNEFDCIPKDVVWRPSRRHRKPRIASMQTATVVGPAGEEIHTDEHGRVQVLFHWDRLSPAKEDASCWIRVMQPWGGAGWGFVFLPRIGMEVVVHFIDGNPDRPLVAGSVYNGAHALPYTMPDEKTKSTIKSNSSLGGGGFNEFRFEDKKGSEEIYIHAQKDFNEVVLNDHTTSVGHDQGNHVGNDQTETVKRHQSLTVSGNREKRVEKDETNTIDQDRITTVHGTDNLTVDGCYTIQVNGGAKKGAGSDCSPAGASLKVTGEYLVDVSSKITRQVNACKITQDGGTVTIDAPTSITLKVGGSTVVIDGASITLTAATVTANGGKGAASVLKLDDAGADLKGGSKVLVHHGATPFLELAGKAVLDGSGDVKIIGGGAHLALKDTADLKGSTTTASGSGASVTLDANATVTGGTVKLNP